MSSSNPYDLTQRLQQQKAAVKFDPVETNPPNLYGGRSQVQTQPQQSQYDQIPLIKLVKEDNVSSKLDNTYEIIQPQDWAKIPNDTYIRWQTVEEPNVFHKGGIVMETFLTKDNDTKIKVKLLGTPYSKHIDIKDVRYIYKKQAKYAPKKVQVDPNTPIDPQDEVRILKKELEKKDQKIKQLTDIIRDISIKLAK